MKSIKRKGYLLASAAINRLVAALSLLTVSACILGLGPRVFSQQTTPPTEASETSLAERVIATPTDAERTILLNSNGSLVNGDLAREIREAVVKGVDKAAPAESLRNLKLGLSVAERAADKKEEARSWNAIGNLQLTPSERLQAYESGLEIAEKDDHQIRGRLMANIGSLQQTWEEQLAYYTKAIDEGQLAGDKKIVAYVYTSIGTHFAIQGEYIAAVEKYRSALELRRQINDLDGISAVLNNLGIVATFTGDLDSAVKNYRDSLAFSEQDGNKGAVGTTSYNLGIIYYLKGDYMHAMELYSKSLKLFEEIGSTGGIEGVSTNIANLYNAQGDYEQARYYLNRAALIYDKTGKTVPRYVMGSLGDSNKEEGQYAKAIGWYEQLLALKEKDGSKDSLTETLINIGDCYLLSGNIERAEQTFQRALVLSRSSGNHVWIARSLIDLAETALERSDFGTALSMCQEAETHIAQLTGATEYWELYEILGRAYRGLGKPDDARSNLEKAITIIEARRTNVAGSSSQVQKFFRSKLSPYHLLIDQLISKGSLEYAFRTSESAKARALIDTLGSRKIRLDKSMTPDESSDQQRLKMALASLNAQLEHENKNAKPDYDKIRVLQGQLNRKRLELEDFQTRMYVAHPGLAAKRGEMNPISSAESAKLLRNDRSALIEYAVAADKTYMFVITKDEKNSTALQSYTIDVSQKDLAGKIEPFRSALAHGDLDFGVAARAIYSLLLKPAAAQLAGKTDLVIVPDGPLWDLPFQCLQDAAGAYLISQAAVSYAPSFTALREMKGEKAKDAVNGKYELLAFANPSVGKETAERVRKVFANEDLRSLPETDRLVNSLKQMYGPDRSRILTGTEAVEGAAKTDAPKYRIIQFATHGILNNASPMYSHLLLAQDAKDPGDDGLLEAWEMKDLDLNAEMVILSACDTARGQISNGEGVIGMSWALFIAGTPTTVASQWAVDSASTTELMLEFHRQILTGKVSKAEALRRAELKLLRSKQYSHPSYWAPFVMVGDGS